MISNSDAAAPDETSFLRVFIADDMPAARAGLTAFLNSLPDIKVVGVTSDGAEAIERIFAEPPDVAIMDIEMPRMDGLEAIQYLRAQGITIFIIAMSTGWEFREQALAAGADAFVYKGEPLSELVALLEQLQPQNVSSTPPGTGAANPPISIIELETAYGLMRWGTE